MRSWYASVALTVVLYVKRDMAPTSNFSFCHYSQFRRPIISPAATLWKGHFSTWSRFPWKFCHHVFNERFISNLTIFIFLFCIFASLQFWSRNNLSGNPLFALSDGVSVSSILSARSLTTADNVQPFKCIICTFLCCHPDNLQKSVFSKYMNMLRHFGDTNIGTVILPIAAIFVKSFSMQLTDSMKRFIAW